MVRGEWALAASLLYREIAASANPRDRGALHLELALIFEERLDDDGQAQVNFEQALAFDPTIPAFTNFVSSDGLPGDSVHAVVVLANGDKVFGTDAGLALYRGP